MANWAERFVKVKDFPNYSVSNKGRVFSHTSQNYLSRVVDGVPRVKLRNGDGIRDVQVAYLVAEHFVGNARRYTKVIHCDRDPLNNKMSNLMWVSDEHYRKHMNNEKIDRRKKYTEADIHTMCSWRCDGESIPDIAYHFGISTGYLSELFQTRLTKHKVKEDGRTIIKWWWAGETPPWVNPYEGYYEETGDEDSDGESYGNIGPW